MSHDPEFDQLKREFLTEAREKVGEIARLFEQDGASQPESLHRMIYLAHQLKGAGGSYGFPSISSDAAALETALEKLGERQSSAVQGQVGERLRNLDHVVESQLRELGAA